jgi:hypothetical protein
MVNVDSQIRRVFLHEKKFRTNEKPATDSKGNFSLII